MVVNETTVTITGYTGPGGAITIPSVIDGLPVTEIGNSVFFNRSDLTGNLVIPQGVTTIGGLAFSQCSGLTGDLVIPEGVTSIGNYAFEDCSGLDGTLTLPSTLETIGDYAFGSCSGLTGNLVIPEGVTSIGNYAFYDCNKLNGALTFPSTLETIGDHAFRYCSGLTGNLVIPEGVTSIGDYAFFYCFGLTGITVESGNLYYSSVDGMLLSKDGTVLIQCPGGKTGSLVIPEGVTSIGDYAFSWCYGLSSVTFMGDAPTTMGSDVFADMSNDLIIYYQPGASGFDAEPWQGLACEVWVENPVDPNWQYTIANNAVTITGYTGAIEDPVIPDTIAGLPVTSIGDRAFWGRTDITGSLTLPSTLETIGDEAFRSCSGLTGDLVIPEGVTLIEDNAFYECSGFDGTIALPSTLTAIGDGAFGGCSGLTGNLVIPASVVTLGEGVFYRCSGLSGSVIIPSTLLSVGNGLFASTGISSVVVQADNPNYSSVDGMLLSKDGSILIHCPSGKTGSLVFPEGVTSIEAQAFFACTGLTGSLVLPEGLTAIERGVFEGCSGFTGNLMIPEGVTSIGSYAFCFGSGFTGTLVLPSNLETMGEFVFYDCSGLTGNVDIPASVVSMAGDVFSSCTGLASVTFKGNAPELGVTGPFDVMAYTFKVYFHQGKEGFDASEWQGIDLEMIPNRAPRFRTIGNKTVRAGQPITFEVIADDEDAGDVLQYSATKP